MNAVSSQSSMEEIFHALSGKSEFTDILFGSRLIAACLAVALVALQQMSGVATFLCREVLLFMSSDELYPVRIEGDARFL